MSPTTLSPEQILSLLRETPPRIAEFTSALTNKQLHATPSPNEWSANDVLAHLRSCSDVWGNAIVTIIEQDKPTIRAMNPRTWIQRTDYLEQKFLSSLQAFAEQRSKLLQLLTSLKPRVWMRSAVVTGAGKTLERTVHSYAEWMATHERPHLKQIKRIADVLQK